MGLEYQEPEARVSNGRGAGVAYRCFEFRRTRAGLSRMNLKSRTAFKLFGSWISLVTCSFAVAVVLAGSPRPLPSVSGSPAAPPRGRACPESPRKKKEGEEKRALQFPLLLLLLLLLLRSALRPLPLLPRRRRGAARWTSSLCCSAGGKKGTFPLLPLTHAAVVSRREKKEKQRGRRRRRGLWL